MADIEELIRGVYRAAREAHAVNAVLTIRPTEDGYWSVSVVDAYDDGSEEQLADVFTDQGLASALEDAVEMMEA